MKLLAHNLLMCNKKGCTINNYPLTIQASKVITKPNEFDEELLKHFLKKIDLNGLNSACRDINMLKVDLLTLTEEQKNSKEFLEYLNTILFETLIEEGSLKCKHCEREYPIKQGIADMVLMDDEL